MINEVKFNTKEKATKCYHLLGKRAIDIFTIEYEGIISGFWVHYFTQKHQ